MLYYFVHCYQERQASQCYFFVFIIRFHYYIICYLPIHMPIWPFHFTEIPFMPKRTNCPVGETKTVWLRPLAAQLPCSVAPIRNRSKCSVNAARCINSCCCGKRCLLRSTAKIFFSNFRDPVCSYNDPVSVIPFPPTTTLCP